MSQKTVNTFFQTRKRATSNARGKSLKDPLRNLDKKSQNVAIQKLVQVQQSPVKTTRTSRSLSRTASPFKAPLEKRELFSSPKKVFDQEIVQVVERSPKPKLVTKPETTSENETVVVEATKVRTPPKRKPDTPTEPKTPDSIKKHLGSTSSLAVLQARLKNITNSSTPSPRARKALFSNDELPRSGNRGRSKTKKGLLHDVESPQLKAPPPSPADGSSPQKKDVPEVGQSPNLVQKLQKQVIQPSKNLPIPESYEHLAILFGRLDELVAMLYNRSESITVTKIKAALQKATNKTVTDDHLKQIRDVFPSAYTFTWEAKLNSAGKKTGDHELYLVPNLTDNDKMANADTPGKTPNKLRINAMTERKKNFKQRLLAIVQDHHNDFLKDRGISGLDENEIHQWHKDFDVEKNCLPIDTLDFPPKPFVEAVERNPLALLEKVRGINKNMEAALNQHIAISTPRKAPMTPTTKKIMDDFKLNPALRDLSPALRDRILAREREKRVREMTTNETEQKEIEKLRELIHNRVRNPTFF